MKQDQSLSAQTNQIGWYQKLHRISAKVVGMFVLIHLFNHLMAVDSVEIHGKTMTLFRNIYRNPLIEMLLLLSVFTQMGTGLILVIKDGRKRQRTIDKIQALTGIYIAIFLSIHLSAVFFLGRFQEVDTEFYFAASGLLSYPSLLFFIPYYSLSILCAGTHITCASYKLICSKWGEAMALKLSIGLGLITLFSTVLIMLAFTGQLYDV